LTDEQRPTNDPNDGEISAAPEADSGSPAASSSRAAGSPTLPPTSAPGESDSSTNPLSEERSPHEQATLPPAGDSPATGEAESITLPPQSISDQIDDPLDLLASAGESADGATASGTQLRYFGDYELLEEIARGGMGVVFKARQVSLNRIVALKMILAGQLASEEDVQRFYTEAEAAANLDHPGIVPIFEVGQHEGQHFFSMGFVDGKSLAQKVADGPLPPREAAELTKRIAEAIVYAHERGVIHRDLKPANILLDDNGRPRVTDFGLAKKMEADSGLTGTGQVLGTPSYMPPEQAAGKTEEIGPTSDVYSLGAILYCLMTGRPPFQSASLMDTLIQVLEQEPVSPRQLNAGINQDLDTICLKCLAKQRSQRYQSTRELVEDLSRYLKGEPISARPRNGSYRLVRKAIRYPIFTGLSCFTGISVGLLLLAVAFQGELIEKVLAGIAILYPFYVYSALHGGYYMFSQVRRCQPERRELAVSVLLGATAGLVVAGVGLSLISFILDVIRQ
jgi:tRNA A-37 threonylcarbamoyl transferase component Bud32